MSSRRKYPRAEPGAGTAPFVVVVAAFNPIDNVPLVVIGEPEIVIPPEPVAATAVTVPDPLPLETPGTYPNAVMTCV